MPQGQEPRSPLSKVQLVTPVVTHQALHSSMISCTLQAFSSGHGEISLTFYLWITKMSSEVKHHVHRNSRYPSELGTSGVPHSKLGGHSPVLSSQQADVTFNT